MLKVLSKRDGERVFIIAEAGASRGFICDLETNRRWPEMEVASLEARGYWGPFEGSKADEKKILDAVLLADRIDVPAAGVDVPSTHDRISMEDMQEIMRDVTLDRESTLTTPAHVEFRKKIEKNVADILKLGYVPDWTLEFPDE